MDSYVRPLIYQDTRGTCSSPIESNTREQSKALNCPLAFFMCILHMTYLIHRKHNSIFPFFKIHIIKSILVFPTTNPTAIVRRKALWYQTLVSSRGIELRTEDLRIKTTCRTSLPILATKATGCDRAWDRTEHSPKTSRYCWVPIKNKRLRTTPPTCHLKSQQDHPKIIASFPMRHRSWILRAWG